MRDRWSLQSLIIYISNRNKSLDLVEEVNGLITEWPVKLDQLQLVIIFPILRCYSDVGLSWYEFVQNEINLFVEHDNVW